MAEINHEERKIRAKIIYYGPAAGGKTTNLLELSRRANTKRRGHMLSINTTQERTLLLDLFGIKANSFCNYDLRFQVIAVPGQRMYAASRRFLLAGADSVVFVANSAADRWQETLESMKEMNEYLAAQGIDPKSIPVVFQYNKQDLPEVTPMEAMEGTLNARKSDSFTAVAIRGVGVLETFSAIMARTLRDMVERLELSDRLQGGPSAEEWVEKTMQMVFGTEAIEETTKDTEEKVEPQKIPSESGASSPAVSDPAVDDDPSEEQRHTAVRVMSPGKLPAATPKPAGTGETAEILVESYVAAAASLAEQLEESQNQHQETRNRLEELSASIDAAQALLSKSSAEEVLVNVIERISKGLGSDVGSLSLVRPDGELSPVVLRNMEAEPLFKLFDEENRPIAVSLMEQDEPAVFKHGDTGPLQAALDELDKNYTSFVAIPIKTPVRALGLACFYLPEESSAPTEEMMPHLVRLGQGLAQALEIASIGIASERLQKIEKAALVGHLTEQFVKEIGSPVDRLLKSIGNAIAQIPQGSGGPPKLLGELLNVSNDLVKAQEMREGVLGFLSGQLPEKGLAPLEELFEWIRNEYTEPLQRTGIELKVERDADVDMVAADAFLLRSTLLALVENFRNYLASCEGAQIRISASRADDNRVRISVSDNVTVMNSSEGPAAIPDYLSWSLDRRVQAFALTLAQKVVEHYGGEWQMSVIDDKGNEFTLTFPAHVETDEPKPAE